jgi:crotonobetainyl-CoA:carnitine CoA-transferase CaiB-like acyl-CoA transferase
VSAPLEGVVVVSLEQAISAPFATRQLADLGATIIKVERPEGDFARAYDGTVRGESAFFVWANRGKQSVVLDIKDPDDLAIFWALVAGADVFVHNIAPGAAGRLGIDATSLHARFPALIACEISGYGAGGPRSDDKAYDLAIQAEAGAFSVTGDAEMSKVGFSAADISAAMYALSGILAALVRRDRTGEGAAIEVSMLDSLAEWMSAPLYAAVYGAGQAPRTGRRHHAIAPYGTFTLADGRTVLLAIQNDREWLSFAELVLGSTELGSDPRFATNAVRIANVDELESIISARFADTPAEEIRAALEAAGIATAHVNDLAQVWQHEQLRARDRFVDVDLPTGQAELLKSPFAISDWDPGVQSVPALGEHDAATVRRIIETD